MIDLSIQELFDLEAVIHYRIIDLITNKIRFKTCDYDDDIEVLINLCFKISDYFESPRDIYERDYNIALRYI